jgi:hypothetical protein
LKGSLENLIKDFQLEKEGIFKLSLDNLEERCKNEAKATWRLFDTLQRFFIEQFNQNIRFTLAATAMEVFRRSYFDDFWFRDEGDIDKDLFERESYYGGRVEVFERGEIEYRSFDVNSMYPAVMAQDYLPKPNSAFWEHNPDTERVMKRLAERKLFILEACMVIPVQHIPPLPGKHPETGKLCFPVGEIEGVWCSPEIAAAVRYGATFKHIGKMLTYSRKEKYLARYAEDIYKKRQKAEKDGNPALKYMFKILLNSLYGKFGERVGQESNYIPLTDEDEIEGKRIVTGLNGREYIAIDPSEKTETQHTFVCISSFITSYARVRLLSGIKDCGEENVIYCDTDSIKVKTGVPIPLEINNTKLGAWKDEGTHTSTFYRPKLYADKMKGVPNRHEVLEVTPEIIRVAFERVIKRKEGIKRKLPQNAFVPAEKVLCLIDDKREWNGNKSKALSWGKWYKSTRF